MEAFFQCREDQSMNEKAALEAPQGSATLDDADVVCEEAILEAFGK